MKRGKVLPNEKYSQMKRGKVSLNEKSKSIFKHPRMQTRNVALSEEEKVFSAAIGRD